MILNNDAADILEFIATLIFRWGHSEVSKECHSQVSEYLTVPSWKRGCPYPAHGLKQHWKWLLFFPRIRDCCSAPSSWPSSALGCSGFCVLPSHLPVPASPCLSWLSTLDWSIAYCLKPYILKTFSCFASRVLSSLEAVVAVGDAVCEKWCSL